MNHCDVALGAVGGGVASAGGGASRRRGAGGGAPAAAAAPSAQAAEAAEAAEERRRIEGASRCADAELHRHFEAAHELLEKSKHVLRHRRHGAWEPIATAVSCRLRTESATAAAAGARAQRRRGAAAAAEAAPCSSGMAALSKSGWTVARRLRTRPPAPFERVRNESAERADAVVRRRGSPTRRAPPTRSPARGIALAAAFGRRRAAASGGGGTRGAGKPAADASGVGGAARRRAAPASPTVSRERESELRALPSDRRAGQPIVTAAPPQHAAAAPSGSGLAVKRRRFHGEERARARLRSRVASSATRARFLVLDARGPSAACGMNEGGARSRQSRAEPIASILIDTSLALYKMRIVAMLARVAASPDEPHPGHARLRLFGPLARLRGVPSSSSSFAHSGAASRKAARC